MSNVWLGPLTTTFTPPNDCTNEAYQIYYVSDSTGNFYVQGPLDVMSCFPSGYGSEITQYYSPGICPRGYTPALVTSETVGTTINTIHTCCPTHFRYTAHFSGHVGWGGCYFDVPATGLGLTSLYTVAYGTTSGYFDTSLNNGAINAQSIQVKFQQSDFMTSLTTTLTLPTVSMFPPLVRTYFIIKHFSIMKVLSFQVDVPAHPCKYRLLSQRRLWRYLQLGPTLLKMPMIAREDWLRVQSLVLVLVSRWVHWPYSGL